MTEQAAMATIRVIGVGNGWRGDDAVGLLAARRLRKRLEPTVTVIEADDGLSLLELMEGTDHVILIDAVKGGGRTGEVVRLDVSRESRWGAIVPYSTHALGLAEVIDLVRSLKRLPKHVVVYGIAIESAESGAPLSQSVRVGLDLVVERVNEEVERARCTKYI